MEKDRITNINIISEQLLPVPAEIRKPSAEETVYYARQQVRAILNRRDSRLLTIVGHCSIHKIDVVLEYARRLKTLSDEV